ncbi:septal ring lytic transglycosylase RlpA family protein [Roseateles sp. SL47]|uniref:septal ring lytic transglycosylase RlpA family protein n=1 Tax=Roseateles sp. SL47 TaxID=2995138 RepID=UPI00226F2979|nr:septal ring lytic transglycosylase RlpA family protein [Roseateles sp. SL47]WAC73973.1 septal ring lytic transglycosylase RlpA family protein [Roseateles sp. SL47]
MFEARPAGQRLAVLTSALFLAACASRGPAPSRPPGPAPASPKVTQWPAKDGPEAVVPADLDKIPDALPRFESIRKGGPNKPYAVAGQRYQPLTDDDKLVQRGLASWYGRKFHGRPTASGEVYNMYAMTAAHPTMPIPSYARVRNPKNGREVIVRINDRGPFHSERIIDLSYTAALKLDLLRGVSEVEVERITYEDIRTGAWLRGKEMPSQPGDRAVPEAPVYAAASPTGAPEVTTTVQMRGTQAATPSTPAPRPATSSNPSSPPVSTSAAGNAVGASAGMVPIPVVALPPGTDLDSPRDVPTMPATASQASGTATSAATPTPDAPLPAMKVAAAAGYWLQLGAFSRLEGAETLREQFNKSLDWMAPMLTIFKDKQLHRLQAGPFSTREDARAAAEKVRTAMALTPVLVERR